MEVKQKSLLSNPGGIQSVLQEFFCFIDDKRKEILAEGIQSKVERKQVEGIKYKVEGLKEWLDIRGISETDKN